MFYLLRLLRLIAGTGAGVFIGWEAIKDGLGGFLARLLPERTRAEWEKVIAEQNKDVFDPQDPNINRRSPGESFSTENPANANKSPWELNTKGMAHGVSAMFNGNGDQQPRMALAPQQGHTKKVADMMRIMELVQQGKVSPQQAALILNDPDSAEQIPSPWQDLVDQGVMPADEVAGARTAAVSVNKSAAEMKQALIKTATDQGGYRSRYAPLKQAGEDVVQGEASLEEATNYARMKAETANAVRAQADAEFAQQRNDIVREFRNKSVDQLQDELRQNIWNTLFNPAAH
jgi:hypothetical protein